MITGRFAPTPSGGIHLGNVFCCLLAYLSARSQGGTFLLRIEDVDVPRCPHSAGERIIEDLRWLGFDWDGPIVWQSERTAAYRAALNRLTELDLTYPCFCTRAELHREAAPNLGETRYRYPGTCAHISRDEANAKAAIQPSAIRLRAADEQIEVHDLVQGMYSENLAEDCGDFVIRRSDGYFAYQLAVVVDDADAGITEIVRGRDLLESTPGQICLQRYLGYPEPVYAHIPLLLAPDGRRLAKRDRDLDMRTLSRRYKPGELLGLLAYTAGLIDHRCSVSLSDLVSAFSWKAISKNDLRLPDL